MKKNYNENLWFKESWVLLANQLVPSFAQICISCLSLVKDTESSEIMKALHISWLSSEQTLEGWAERLRPCQWLCGEETAMCIHPFTHQRLHARNKHFKMFQHLGIFYQSSKQPQIQIHRKTNTLYQQLTGQLLLLSSHFFYFHPQKNEMHIMSHFSQFFHSFIHSFFLFLSACLPPSFLSFSTHSFSKLSPGTNEKKMMKVCHWCLLIFLKARIALTRKT